MDNSNTLDKDLQAPATEYMIMSVEANEVNSLYNLLAGVSAWVTLAGFITLPNTFTSLQASDSLASTAGGEIIQDRVRNVPILPLAGVLCFAGIAGTSFLWWKFKSNYMGLVSNLFSPGISNALISLLSTVVNIISTQNGDVSVTAGVTIGIVMALLSGMLCLWIIHKKRLRDLKILHERELARHRIKQNIQVRRFEEE